MTESIYKEYQNKYYNPNDNDKRPGDNDNWKSIQEGFHRIGSTQLETSEGLTLGKGTADETSVTAAELKAMKNVSKIRVNDIYEQPAGGTITVTGGETVSRNLTGTEILDIKRVLLAMFDDGARYFIINPVLKTGPYTDYQNLTITLNALGANGLAYVGGLGVITSRADMEAIDGINLRFYNSGEGVLNIPNQIYFVITGV